MVHYVSLLYKSQWVLIDGVVLICMKPPDPERWQVRSFSVENVPFHHRAAFLFLAWSHSGGTLKYGHIYSWTQFPCFSVCFCAVDEVISLSASNQPKLTKSTPNPNVTQQRDNYCDITPHDVTCTLQMSSFDVFSIRPLSCASLCAGPGAVCDQLQWINANWEASVHCWALPSAPSGSPEDGPHLRPEDFQRRHLRRDPPQTHRGHTVI